MAQDGGFGFSTQPHPSFGSSQFLSASVTVLPQSFTRQGASYDRWKLRTYKFFGVDESNPWMSAHKRCGVQSSSLLKFTSLQTLLQVKANSRRTSRNLLFKSFHCSSTIKFTRTQMFAPTLLFRLGYTSPPL
jgi:hypothetical protein